MWDGKLSEGSAVLLHQGRSDVGRGSVLQVINTKPIQQLSGTRVRVVLSDGKQKISAVLASQVCAKVQHVNLDGAIVRINEFQLNGLNAATPGAPKILLVTNMDILADKRPTIGNPVDLAPPGAGGAPGAMVKQPTAHPPAAASPVKPPYQASVPTAAGGARSAPVSQQSSVPAAAAAPAASHFAPPPAAAGLGDGPTSFGQHIDHARVSPISSLNPYSTANWTIKARVSNKSQIRTYSNTKNANGKLFSVELVDQDGEIRATGFGSTVDDLYPVLIPGKVYYISKGDVKQANKKFSGNINNNYEITFNHNTSVELAADDADPLPMQHYRFSKIKDLPELEMNSTTDILGVILDATDLTSRNTRVGESSHRQFTVGDNSKTSVSVSLWGKAAETARDWPVGGIVAIKSVKIGDFGGISLSGGAQTGLELMPDLQEAVQLRTWLDGEGAGCVYHPLTSGRGPRRDAGDGHGGQNANVQHQPAKWLTFAEANKITDPAACQPFWAYATVQNIKHDANSQWTYPACPKCNKKMVQQAGGGADGWECHNEKCRHVGAPQRRFTLQIALLDHTGVVYTTAFNETGEKFLKSTAPELFALQEAGQMTPLEHRFQDALMRTWKVKLLPKFETYMEKNRLKIGMLDAEPVDFAESTKFLLDRLTILENS